MNSQYPIQHGSIRLPGAVTTDIHIEKLDELGRALVERGLARRGLIWYAVEEFTARQFMAYLATKIGILEDVESDPITDELHAFNFLVSHEQEKQEAIQARILEDILPIPEGPIDAYRLLNFKERYTQELLHYRGRIERFLESLTTISDEEFRKDRVNAFIFDMQEEIRELSSIVAALHPERRVAFGSLLTYAPAVLDGGLSLLAIAGGLLLGSGRPDPLAGKSAAYAVLVQHKLR